MTDAPRTDALSLLDDLVDMARKAGADAADAVLVDGRSLSVSCRLGVLESLDRSEAQDIGLRVFVGQRQALVSSADRSKAALTTLVEQALAMARAVPEDSFAGLADPDQVARPGTIPDVDGFDPFEPSAEQLIDLARATEDAARAVPGITNSEGGSAGWGQSHIAVVASNGFAYGYSQSHASLSAVVLAGQADQGGMERDYDYSTAVYWSDLHDPEEIGRSAGERTVRRLGATRMRTGTLPVVFEPRIARGLVGNLVAAINGASVARGTSFLKDRMGEEIFAPGVSILEDPLRPRGLRSRPVDVEGLLSRPRALIDNGCLTTWLLDLRSARQLGLAATGHASRGTSSPPSPSASNVWLAAGAVSPQDLIADIAEGLYVTDLFGQGVNMITGDYSRGCAGFRIENGTLTTAVNETTIAGNLKTMFPALTPANDLEFRYGTDAPTVRIDGMTIAGA